MKPQRFGSYTLVERLGSGGMAEVFLATTGQGRLRRFVAIKRIHRHLAHNRKSVSMFVDEANIAARLSHPNIVQIYEFGEVAGQCFIAMEFLHGRDLLAVFQRCKSIGRAAPNSLVCHIGVGLCDGLDYAHSHRDYCGRDLGFIHRDISLHNLIVSFDGQLKIVDFGIAKAAGRTATTDTGSIKGKLAYMSPEQVRGRPLDRRSDIFSCGIVLFELLTGQRLFYAHDIRQSVARLRKLDIPSVRSLNPSAPPELAAVVHKALSGDPDDRYHTAGHMRDAIAGVAAQRGLRIGRARVAAWMKRLYADEFATESRHVAGLWAVASDLDTPRARTLPGWVPFAAPDPQTG